MTKKSFSVLKKIYKHLRVKGKPLTVHTEMIIDDKVWEEIKKKVENNEVHTWYLITPINSNIFYALFRLKMNTASYEKTLIKRYLWLKKKKQRLQLHVHLCKNMKNISYIEQEFLIKKAIEWFEDNLNLKVNEMVPGWWKCNKDTKSILDFLNIKLIKRFEYQDCHDYDWID